MTEEQDGSAQEQEIDAPLVFQCKNCRCIVGDSFSWVSAHEGLNAVCLEEPSPFVKMVNELHTSYSGTDIGSTYLRFLCSSCDSVIGKIYKTTARHLDAIR
eukprot:Colp12_sorted_trinity150504_noHs@2365